jgi:hypothetical protein
MAKTAVEDCRELFPLRDRIMDAVAEIMKDRPYNGSFGIGVRRMPKGVVYKDETNPGSVEDNGG